AVAEGQGESGDQGVLVAGKAGGEAVQSWQVVGPDGVDPLWQPVSAQVLDHVGEAADVVACGLQLGAAGEDALELDGRAFAQVVGVGHDPGCDLAGLRRCRRGWRRLGPFAQLGDVAADGALSTAPAQAAQLAVQRRGVVAPFGEALVEVVLEPVQAARTVVGPAEVLLQRCADEAVDGTCADPQLAGDL